jgi:hypothetical protein
MDATGNYGEDYGGGVTWLKPPYKPGEVLYVRETWAVSGGVIIYKADPVFTNCKSWYTAWIWRPSIHMPREAARIFLKVTSVRVERLKDITEADAHAEGAMFPFCPITVDYCTDSIGWFGALWNELNAKKPEYLWGESPWVWVIGFERTEAVK